LAPPDFFVTALVEIEPENPDSLDHDKRDFTIIIAR